ncbi:MAG: GNAT family N-acetyltransferase [Chloroflexi bacterium]|nr:GNAT family N-acetyltransferase [Chloroflexota bacterium]
MAKTIDIVAQSSPDGSYVVIPLCKDDLAEVARVHMEAFDGEFLAAMGEGFLSHFYAAYLASGEAVSFVCQERDNSRFVGFISGTTDIQKHYMVLLRRELPFLAFYAVLRIFQQPTLWRPIVRRAFRVFRLALPLKSSPVSVPEREPVTEEILWEVLPPASLMSMGVLNAYRKRGIGELLVHAFVQQLEARGVPALRLGVKADNIAALNLYRKLGWRVARKSDRGLGDVRFLMVRRLTPARAIEEAERIKGVYLLYGTDPRERAKRLPGNRGNQAMVAERRARVAEFLLRSDLLPLAGKRIIDVGCGNGDFLGEILVAGATPALLHGVDVLEDRIEAARSHYPEINFLCQDAASLPFPAESFDLVANFTLFSSVLDPDLAQRIAEEEWRILKSGGAILWYDVRYKNPSNPYTRHVGVGELHWLFPKSSLDLETITLIPPLARRFGVFTPILYPLLAAVPVLRTHYIGILRKP